MSNWLTYSPVSGHGNTQITLSASTLTGLEDRIATLIATGSQEGQTLSATTVITQKYLTLTEIYFENLTWSTDVAWSGGTATSANCSFSVIAKYSDNSTEDITNKATISGSLAVPATTATTRQSVGTLTLTATYEDKTCTGNIAVYQEAPLLSDIFFSALNWVTDVAWSGGTATKDNCSYTIFAKYSNNVQANITSEAEVTGSLAVPVTTAITRQSVGNLELTATFGGKTCTVNVTAYQEAPLLSEIYFNSLEWVTDISATGGTATKDNCNYSVYAKYSNNVQVDVTNEATVSGSLVVPISTKLTRQVVGTLSLTAEYESLTCNGSVTAYQEAPSLSEIYFENLIWVTDVPGTGGTATKDNCSYTIFAKYSNNVQVDVTSEAEVTGSLVVEYSIIEERHSAGTLSLTAKYENLFLFGSVTAYQEANYRDYLKFTFVSDGTWIYPNSKEKIEYSINNGKWIRIYAKQLSVLSGDTIRVRGTNNVYDNNTFGGTAYFNLSGNIMALIGGVNYEDLKELNYNRAFQQIFANSNVVEASELLLPATALTDYCYDSMFKGCTSLTTPPSLPATTLSEYAPQYPEYGQYCYRGMFEGCTSLTTAPALPATALTNYCYYSMFAGCTSLTTAPALPATTLAQYCYTDMFANCTSLATAPALPATKLEGLCYMGMFSGCKSLTTAPALPATTLAEGCYSGMFQFCSSLTTAPELPVTTLAPYCYKVMFSNCTSLTAAPELPATDLAEDCYYGMFQGCTSLTVAPSILPAMTLKSSCCDSMFRNCSSLTTAPELPATDLRVYCCRDMFYGCTSLTTAPELPATDLADDCYYGMFEGCTSLTTAPSILPAMALYSSCYQSMFKGCTSLTTAPVLPATNTGREFCYKEMFWNCSSLNYIKSLAEDINGYNESNWVYGVAATGTFVKNPKMTEWTTGASGIPEGWTVIDAS